MGQVPSSVWWQSVSPSAAMRCAGQQFWGPKADSDAIWHDNQMIAAQRRYRRKNIMRIVSSRPVYTDARLHGSGQTLSIGCLGALALGRWGSLLVLP
jgi:hypothetical protein